jgi:hypothetical protein
MNRPNNRRFGGFAVAAGVLLLLGGAIAVAGPSSATTVRPGQAQEDGHAHDDGSSHDGHSHDGHSHGPDGHGHDSRSQGHRPVTALPANDPKRGLVYDGLQVSTSGPCKGMFEVRNVPGACTHGPDAPLPGLDVKRRVPPAPKATDLRTKSVICDGDGKSGNRVEVLYVRGSGKASRYNEYLASFQGWASEVDGIFDASARKTGGTRHVRYVTDSGCNVTVTQVVIADSRLADFGESVNAIKEQGYDRTDRKYLMFVDTDALCGVAFVFPDSRPGQNNINNSGPSFARVDNGCWTPGPAAHELTHALGSVNSDSPNHTDYGHCTDDYDLMCYQDGPGTVMRIICPDRAQDNLLDCNNDDYFSTNPNRGSYLDTHWNTANNRFLINR